MHMFILYEIFKNVVGPKRSIPFLPHYCFSVSEMSGMKAVVDKLNNDGAGWRILNGQPGLHSDSVLITSHTSPFALRLGKTMAGYEIQTPGATKTVPDFSSFIEIVAGQLDNYSKFVAAHRGSDLEKAYSEIPMP